MLGTELVAALAGPKRLGVPLVAVALDARYRARRPNCVLFRPRIARALPGCIITRNAIFLSELLTPGETRRRIGMSEPLPRTISRTLQFKNGCAVGISNRWHKGQYCTILTEAGLVGCGIYDVKTAAEFGQAVAIA